MTEEFHTLLKTNRELKMRCIELAAQLLRPNGNPTEIINLSETLYAALPLNADTSYSAGAARKALQRESRKAEEGQAKV